MFSINGNRRKELSEDENQLKMKEMMEMQEKLSYHYKSQFCTMRVPEYFSINIKFNWKGKNR